MAERVIPASMKNMYEQFRFAPGVKDGDRLFMSGQIGTKPDGSVPADVEEQFNLAFDGVATILKEAGASWADVVEMTTYHVGLGEHIGSFVKVKNQHVAEPYPAWTAIGVSELAFPGALVEIRAIARLR
jgi:enamine deaminase RidA (YjgF/YER057c/UK114 family)